MYKHLISIAQTEWSSPSVKVHRALSHSTTDNTDRLRLHSQDLIPATRRGHPFREYSQRTQDDLVVIACVPAHQELQITVHQPLVRTELRRNGNTQVHQVLLSGNPFASGFDHRSSPRRRCHCSRRYESVTRHQRQPFRRGWKSVV